jgi:hypothetical protein
MGDMLALGIAVNVLTFNALLDATVTVAALGPLGKGEQVISLSLLA